MLNFRYRLIGLSLYCKADGKVDVYWYLQAGEPVAMNDSEGRRCQKNDTVEAGSVIGYVGITGNADPERPHLHFGVKIDGTYVNPNQHLIMDIDKTQKSAYTFLTPCDK